MQLLAWPCVMIFMLSGHLSPYILSSRPPCIAVTWTRKPHSQLKTFSINMKYPSLVCNMLQGRTLT